MRLGIIGAGAIVREFLPDLCTLPGLAVIAVQGTPRSAEKTAALCAQHGVPRAVQDLESLLALEPDLVYIATPNHLHFPCAMQVLERGLPVLVEKPLAGTWAQAQALAEQARRHGATVWEAVTTPYLPTYQKLRKWLPRVGAVRRVECDFSQRSSRYDAFLSGQTPPVFDPQKEGGTLMDLNVYNLHFALGLFGAPQGAAYAPEIERGIDTAGTLTLTYPGFSARLTAAKSRGAHRRRHPLPVRRSPDKIKSSITRRYFYVYAQQRCLHKARRPLRHPHPDRRRVRLHRHAGKGRHGHVLYQKRGGISVAARRQL